MSISIGPKEILDFRREKITAKMIETIVVISFALLFLISLVGLFNERLLLQFVNEYSLGMLPLAKVSAKTGNVVRKTRVDTLWIPIYMAKPVYDGDRIVTYADSTIEISMGDQAKLFVEPNSVVRLRQIDGHPLIRISEGSVKAEFLKDQTIFIKRGAQIEEVVVRKGEYFIKSNSSAGVQITTFSQSNKQIAGKKDVEKNVKMEATEAVDEKSDEKSDKSLAETTAQAKQALALEELNFMYDLPTPAPHTLFLRKTKAISPAATEEFEFFISATQRCENKCKMTLYFNKEIFRQADFQSPQQPLLRIAPSEIKNGDYRWIFESDNYNFESDFKVRDYSVELLNDAIANDEPVEIR